MKAKLRVCLTFANKTSIVNRGFLSLCNVLRKIVFNTIGMNYAGVSGGCDREGIIIHYLIIIKF